MEQLRKVGQICRQHYEKLVLSLALLLLGVAVLYLFSESKTQAEIIRKIPVDYERKVVSTVKPVNLTNHLLSVKQAESPRVLDFSQPHHLFNPVQWQVLPGSTVPIKKVTGEETGPRSILISGLRPYRLKVGYLVAASSGAGELAQVSGYWIGVTNEAVLRITPINKREFKVMLSLNITNQTSPVALTGVKGLPVTPESVTAMLRDTGEKFELVPDKAPYEKIIGYETRLQIANSTNLLERGAYLRVNSSVEIDGQGYKIVDISNNEVKVIADSNQKPYSITKVAP